MDERCLTDDATAAATNLTEDFKQPVAKEDASHHHCWLSGKNIAASAISPSMAGACHVVPIAGAAVVGDGEETHLLLKGRRQSAREGQQHPGHVCLDGRDLPWILRGMYSSGEGYVQIRHC